MSAFIVSKKHIDTLVTAALEGFDGLNPYTWRGHGAGFSYYWDKPGVPGGAREYVREENANEVGQMLVDACVRSVYYRYPSDRSNLPGPCVAYYDDLPYRYKRAPRVSAAALAKAIHCFEYQSCEHPDWTNSQAYALCKGLECHILCHLPGYEDAPWDIAS